MNMHDPERVASHPIFREPALKECLLMAQHWHREQTRTNGVSPYWIHPARVAIRLREAGVQDVVTLQAGLLHDVLEDTAADWGEIEHRFGRDVHLLVQGLTHHKTMSRASYMQGFEDSDPRACLVKLADRLDNLSDDWVGMDPGYKPRYSIESLDLVASCWRNARIQHDWDDGKRRALQSLSSQLLQVCQDLFFESLPPLKPEVAA